MKVEQLLVQTTFQNVQARSPLLCDQTEGAPCCLSCFKVVFLCADRRALEFYSKTGFECPHRLPKWQRGAAPPTTADHRRQQGRQLSARHSTILHLTAGKATQEAHASRQPPGWGETRDEDQSRETKVIVASKDVPKHCVISKNAKSQGQKPVSSLEL